MKPLSPVLTFFFVLSFAADVGFLILQSILKPGTIYLWDWERLAAEAFFNFLLYFFLVRRMRRSEHHQAAVAKELDRFFSIVIHDLKSPLAALMMALELKKEVLEAKFFELCKRNIQIAVDLVNDLLDMIQVRAERVPVIKTQCPVKQVVEAVLVMFQERCREKGIELVTAIEECSSYCDPNRLRQVIANLVGNALKYTERGSIKVIIKDREKDCYFEVADTGRGIPPNKINDIFKPFTQVWDGDRYSGTGLGLSIVKGFVEAHEGSVWVTSELGKGSRFSFTIPKSLS